MLDAPDFIYAALIMKHEGMYIGRGDGTRILDLLFLSPSTEYKDILNKIALIKFGALLKAPYWPDLQTKEIVEKRNRGATHSDAFPVFNDVNIPYDFEFGRMKK